jgi:hypothetical protein
MKLQYISHNENDPSAVVCAGRFGLVSRRPGFVKTDAELLGNPPVQQFAF